MGNEFVLAYLGGVWSQIKIPYIKKCWNFSHNNYRETTFVEFMFINFVSLYL